MTWGDAGLELPSRWFGDDPVDATRHWHRQGATHSAGVVAQEFVLGALTGRGIGEDGLADQAENRGWYRPGLGTPWAAVGSLLEAHGVPVCRRTGTLAELVDALARGRRVIVGVESGELAGPGPGAPLERYAGVPGSGALHAVQVIGVDATDAARPMVVVNDPRPADGRGGVLELGAFLLAWAGAGNPMVLTGRAS